MGGLCDVRVDVALAIVEELDHTGRIREVALALEHAKRPRAPRHEVHAPVVHALDHLGDLARAADLAQPVVGEPQDPELALVAQALVHHRLVALLEDVQRDQLARQRDEPQREQRKLADEPVWHAERSLWPGGALGPGWPTYGLRALSSRL